MPPQDPEAYGHHRSIVVDAYSIWTIALLAWRVRASGSASLQTPNTPSALWNAGAGDCPDSSPSAPVHELLSSDSRHDRATDDLEPHEGLNQTREYVQDAEREYDRADPHPGIRVGSAPPLGRVVHATTICHEQSCRNKSHVPARPQTPRYISRRTRLRGSEWCWVGR